MNTPSSDSSSAVGTNLSDEDADRLASLEETYARYSRKIELIRKRISAARQKGFLDMAGAGREMLHNHLRSRAVTKAEINELRKKAGLPVLVPYEYGEGEYGPEE